MEAAKWHRCIDVATERHRKAGPREILAVARELYPDQLAAEDAAAADRGHLRDLATALRTITDDSDGGAGPTETLPLPGFPAPAYVAIKGDIGSGVIKYRNLVKSELEAYLDQKIAQRRYLTRRIEDQRRKNQYLFPFMRDDRTTVQEAVALRSKAAAA